jgi:D-beta-D-heptose 7-phosphate kinase/D-beta-D-heptose 1-phosphate adenosyltransferase
LLTEARKQCDTLVVGINSDAAIKKLKGVSHHFEGLSLRREALRPYCDVVIEFEEDTPIELILRLRPDVLIRGDEGGLPLGWHLVPRRFLVPKLPGYSTTEEIRKRA